MLSNDMILDQGFEENASLANNVCNVCLLLCLCKLLHPTDEAIIPYEFHVPESCVHQVCIRLMCMHINFSTSRNYALHNVPYMTLKTLPSLKTHQNQPQVKVSNPSCVHSLHVCPQSRCMLPMLIRSHFLGNGLVTVVSHPCLF